MENLSKESRVNFTHLGCLDSASLAQCFNAYADECPGEDINSIGFNPNSGYAYIALENGICIGSAFNRPPEFIVSDWNTGEELFFTTYEEAWNYQPSAEWER